MKLIDISPVVSSETAVFPGDTQFEQQVLMDCDQGDALGLSWFKTTPHIGAHADAPKHYASQGEDIAERDLSTYVGAAQVIHVNLKPLERILPEHLSIEVTCPRVLFRTDSYKDPQRWTNDFNALTPELIHYLAGKGVRLVGIDTPSVDLAEDKVLHTHHAIAEHDMAILEGIVLSEVPPGDYFLSAAPLKMKNLDASPVRAYLIKNGAPIF